MRAGLGPGMRAIDVGCGQLGALGVLSELVGPNGVVVGLDTNADALLGMPLERAAASAEIHRVSQANVVVPRGGSTPQSCQT